MLPKLSAVCAAALACVLLLTIAAHIRGYITLPLVTCANETLPSADGDKYADDENWTKFSGRLYIPDVGIDVALYRSNAQHVVDRPDSAAYFDLAPWQGHMVIADHQHQDFSALHSVLPGMRCRIAPPQGDDMWYVCVRVMDGVNTGRYIAEESGRICMADADLLMYTCRAGWEYVRIALFNKCEPPDTEVTGYDTGK